MSASELNVCHIITRLIIGGAQENTLLSCEGLHGRGHDVTLITGPDAGPEGSLLERARGGGYRVEVVGSLRRAVRPLEDWRARRDLYRLLRSNRPDVVHTHSSKAGVLGRMAARDAGIPAIVHTIHGMSFNRTQAGPIRWLYRNLERFCARFTGRIISVADAMTAQAVAAGIAPAEKFTTVYSGMRTDLFSPELYDRQAVRAAWGVREDEVVIGTVARLFANKGYEQLIPAMAVAVQACPKLRFVWVGDGAGREAYERRLEAEGIRERVHLTGLIPPDEVPRVLSGFDVLAHASQWEGLPRAAVQALLMRVPVISFAIDGAPEVVLPGQTGELVPLNDIGGLADAMIRLGANADTRARLGTAGRTLCLERFDHRNMVSQLEQIYRELLAP
jgi:glycosyltransferase involved in cell wall biosynthesis